MRVSRKSLIFVFATVFAGWFVFLAGLQLYRDEPFIPPKMETAEFLSMQLAVASVLGVAGMLVTALLGYLPFMRTARNEANSAS